MTLETRTTDETTGAQKGVKLERFDLVPVGPITELARHYGLGAFKYADRNWEQGMAWSKCYQAGLRHITAFWGGEDLDPDPFYDQFPAEVRPKHVVAGMWHMAALAQYMDQNRDKDDRPRPCGQTVWEKTSELYVPTARCLACGHGMVLHHDQEGAPCACRMTHVYPDASEPCGCDRALHR